MKKKRFPLLRLSPIWPAILSAVFAPGIGQIANREYKKGVFLLFASIGGSMYFFTVIGQRLSLLLPGTPDQWQDPLALQNAVNKLIMETPSVFLTFMTLMIVVWVFSVVDAYITARHLQLEAKNKLNEEAPTDSVG